MNVLNYPYSLRRFLALSSLCLISLVSFCNCRPLGADRPTRVESGLKYESGQPEFDRFFSEFHAAQALDLRAADEERALRREAAKSLKLDEGGTPQLLLDTIARRARELANHKHLVELRVEGLGADDDTDTMVSAVVSGDLDAEERGFVEASTLWARKELRSAANLRKAKKTHERLALQAAALEPSVESYFEAQGYAKIEEVRRNLAAAKRNLPLMSLRAGDQAEQQEQMVTHVRAALTTTSTSANKDEPALITNAASPPEPKRPRAAPRARPPAGSATPKTKKPAEESDSGDFDP